MSRQQGSTVKVPQTRAELQALIARRDELQQQLRDADDRRVNLAAQLGRTPSEARTPVSERVTALDGRITQLERQIAQLDGAISTAMSDAKLTQGQGLLEQAPQPAQPPQPPQQPGFPGADVAPPPGEAGTAVPPREGISPDAERVLVFGGMAAIVFAALSGYVAWRMAVRRFRQMGGGANSAHMAQLQQSVDAIALEVERISENQRYVTKIVNGLGAGAAEPVQQAAAEREPRAR